MNHTDFQIVYWNKAAERIFGFAKDEALGRHAAERILPESSREAVDSVWRNLLTNRGGERSTNENITKDGRTILCEWYNTPLANQDGKVIGVASLVDDITEKRTSEEMIWRQANFDVLTGLPNRNMFHDRLAQEANKSHRTDLPVALLLVDLDEFKEVNDTLGHDVGDHLLQEAGRRIRACVRDSDTVARLGGDEFTIILPDLRGKYRVDSVAQKIIAELVEEYHLGDEVVHISGSIGIALYPHDAKDVDTLIKHADQAMYEAKKRGRNRFNYFTQSLQDAAQNRLRLANDLRSALNSKQLQVYFQPIIEVGTDRIYKAEALVRWPHPKRGMVSPLEFIPLAEDTGLINKVGDFVFREAARWANRWSAKFESSFQVTINISPVQFKVGSEFFTKLWLDSLQESSLSGENIVVEITEGLLLNVESEVIQKLLWLRDSGIQVAIDDFGTGYSSLSYLKEFDIDYLKIDQMFVRNLEMDANDVALTEAIIVMAHKLGLKVIAEGVEKNEQRKLLAEAGCDYIQGYLYSEPIPPSEFESLLLHQQAGQSLVRESS